MERPKVGVAAIIMNDGKVLLGKRIGSHGEGSWSFPGGHLEYGESPENCAARETMEEAGINVKNPRVSAFTNDIFESDSKHYITIFVVFEYDSGSVKIMEPEKIEKWEWFPWNNLPKPLFLPIQNLLTQKFDPFKKI